MDLKQYGILALLITIFVLGFFCLYCQNFFEPFVTTSELDSLIGNNSSIIPINEEIKDIACSDTNVYIALDKSILVYDLSTKKKIHTLTTNSEYEIIKLLVLPNEKLLVSFLDNKLTLYNTTDYTFKTKTYSDINIITNIQYSPTYNVIVTSCDNNTILLIDTNLDNQDTININNDVFDNFITDSIIYNDSLYICSQFKLSELSKNNVTHYPTHQRTSSVININGKIYCGTIDGIIMELDKSNNFVLFKTIPNAKVQRLLAINDQYMVVSVILPNNSYATYMYDTSNKDNHYVIDTYGNNIYYYNNKLIASDNKNNIKIFDTEFPKNTIITTKAEDIPIPTPIPTLPTFPNKPNEITKTMPVIRPPTTQAPPPTAPPPIPTSAIKTTQAISVNPEYFNLQIVYSDITPVTYDINNKIWKGNGVTLYYDNKPDEESWVITGLNDSDYYYNQINESNIKDIIGKHKWTGNTDIVVEKYTPDSSVTQSSNTDNSFQPTKESIDTMELGILTIYD
tara:strand:+ start:1086 stop:2618 length:1533 start_codon:yes stop_codon:yes gene_type:complete